MFRAPGLAMLLASLLLGTAGAGGPGETSGKKQYDPETEFKALDKNQDGKVSREEFLARAERTRAKLGEEKAARLRQFLDRVFDRLDTAKRGYLTLEQFKQWGEMPPPALQEKKAKD
jgi:hypothetical protein